MTRRRWIADECRDNRALLNGANAEHLSRVLRARPGQEFEIVAGGSVFLGRISAISDQQVVFDLLNEVAPDSAAATAPIYLYLAIFKFDRMEWAIEKATELGVAGIVPLIARRSDAHLVTAAAKRVERWRRIAHESAQQSRRDTLPEVKEPIKFRTALQGPEAGKIVLSEYEKQTSLPAALRTTSPEQSLGLAVGPEGGWSEEELAAFSAAGWMAASLGPHILRAETACIAALAIVNGVLGELSYISGKD